MNRLYISGPMSGQTDHNLPAFFAAADTVRSLGYLVENPGDNDGATLEAALGNAGTTGRTWSDYLRVDLARLAKCDGVVVLPGWQQSRGATLEVDVATRLGMPIMCLVPGCVKDSLDCVPQCHPWQLVPRVRCIGISGYARAGKDTLGHVLVERHGYIRASFADKLKELALLIDPRLSDDLYYNPITVKDHVEAVGWEKAKETPEVRRLLQAIGTGVRDIIGANTWVELAMRDIPDGSKVVFTDARFPSEAEAIKASGGVIWRMSRNGCNPVNGHVSEVALDDWNFDLAIPNNGTLADLEHIVDMAMVA